MGTSEARVEALDATVRIEANQSAERQAAKLQAAVHYYERALIAAEDALARVQAKAAKLNDHTATVTEHEIPAARADAERLAGALADARAAAGKAGL
jgi:hypothetical protein